MDARYRTTYLDEPKGFKGRFGAVDGGFNVVQEQGNVTDYPGPGDCHPFEVNRLSVQGGRVNQPYTGFFASWFDNYRVDYLDNLARFAYKDLLGASEFPNDVDLATEAAARTNPSRPYVDVSANILEMATNVKLIKQQGADFLWKIARYGAYRNRHGFKKAVKKFGDINLQYNFGIAPLVGDLVKLCDFQAAFNRRCKEIIRLRGRRGFRKTINMGRMSRAVDFNDVYQSVDKFISGTGRYIATEEVHVHCRWVTTEDPSHLMADVEMMKLLRSAMNNMSISATALWEAVPWSWLIDWASNIGTYFKATANIIPAYLDGVHVIRAYRGEWCVGQIKDQNWVMDPFVIKYESITRKPSFVFPTAHIPFLSGKQMGILASLAVTRA